MTETLRREPWSLLLLYLIWIGDGGNISAASPLHLVAINEQLASRNVIKLNLIRFFVTQIYCKSMIALEVIL